MPEPTHFIYDPSLKKKKEELSNVIKEVRRKPIPHDVLFLRRFIRACIFCMADSGKRKEIEAGAERFRRMPVKPVLPEPPRPITKLVPVNH